ncbi:MAG: hypothetical protein KDC42_06190 [Ignavibacteriae bacterium]|nr:hypothetical protein [Ignavibacteriota bacterium]
MIDVENRDGHIKAMKCDPPHDCILEGNIPSGSEIKIYIKRRVLTEIDDYMASDINKELGGVLIGDLCENSSGERFIYIRNYVHAKHTTASVSRLTFTHDTWEHFDREIEKKFPDQIVLGWYHSHPGHTVFLSGHDMFIQENFFNMDFMVAYVYDPTINERGFFYWNDKKTEKSSGYYVAIEEGDKVFSAGGGSVLDDKPQEEEYVQYPEPEADDKPKGGNGFKNILIIILLIGNVLLSLFLFYQYTEIEKRTRSSEQLLQDMSELKENYRNLNQKLENFIIESEMKQNKVDSLMNDSLKSDSMITK